MAYSPSEKYPGAVDSDPNYQGGKFRDNNPSTTNNGSPLKAIDRNEFLARDEAIMNDAGFEYNGLPDTPQDSQMFRAYKASLGNGANLLSNHNFLIQTPDDSQPLPSSTPTSYAPGYEIFSGVFANETSGITNLTYIDGRVSFSGGDLYFAVPNTGAIARLDSSQLVASVADFDGKPRTRGVSFGLVGDEYRVTVGIDALEDTEANETLLGSVKFEQGSVATRHEAIQNPQETSHAGDVQIVGGGIWPVEPTTSIASGEVIPSGTKSIRLNGSRYLFISQDGNRTIPNGEITNIQSLIAPYTADVGGVSVYLLVTREDFDHPYWNVMAYGAAGDKATNDSPSINACVQATGQNGLVYFPEPKDMYRMNEGINERTNGGRRKLLGVNRRSTQIYIPATISTPNGYAMWFGNSNGHGSYGLQLENLGFFAEYVAINKPSAVMVQEGGQSTITSCYFNNFNHAVRGTAATDVVFYGKTEIYNCVFGLFFNEVYNGTPTEWDATTSLGPFSPSNEVRINWVWFSNVKSPITLGGDNCEIAYSTCQSCGDSPTDDLFLISTTLFGAGWTNSQFGGADVHHNWVEGGTFRYAVRYDALRNGRTYNNLFVGDGSPSGNSKEGAVLYSDGSVGGETYGNTFYQFFTATATEGRQEPAALYVTSDSLSGHTPGKNNFTRTQAGNHPYYEGTPGPTLSKSQVANIFAVVEVDESTKEATIKNGIGITTTPIKIESEGRYRFPLAFTLENGGADIPFDVTVNQFFSGSPAVPVSCFANTGQSIEVEFYGAGTTTRKSPKVFTISVKTEW